MRQHCKYLLVTSSLLLAFSSTSAFSMSDAEQEEREKQFKVQLKEQKLRALKNSKRVDRLLNINSSQKKNSNQK